MVNRILLTKLVLTFSLTILGQVVFAQKFSPDSFGFVPSPEFRELIKQRHYQLVSAFGMVDADHPNNIVATVIKNDKPYYLNLEDVETPYYDINSRFVRERERRMQKPFKDAEKAYRNILFRSDDNYKNVLVGDQYGLVRKFDNKPVLKAEYQWIKCYPANFVVFKQNGLYGLADTLGKVFAAPKYDAIDPCMVDSNAVDLFIAAKDGFVTLVNRKGKELFPAKYRKISPFAVQGVLTSLTSINGELQYGLIGKDGSVLLEPYCRDFVTIPNSDFLRSEISSTNKSGLVNKKGEIILQPIYDNVSNSVENGFVYFRKDGKVGLVDQKGKIAIDLIYSKLHVDTLNQTIIVGLEVKSDKPFTEYKYGLIDYNNHILIPIQYDELIKIDNSYLGKKSGKYYLVDKSEKVLHSYQYSYMQRVNNYFIAIDKNKNSGVIDKDDKIIIPFVYSRIEPTGGYYFATPKGIFSPKNEQVASGNILDVTFTNNLPLRANGIFVFLNFGASEIFRDRYGNEYTPNTKAKN